MFKNSTTVSDDYYYVLNIISIFLILITLVLVVHAILGGVIVVCQSSVLGGVSLIRDKLLVFTRLRGLIFCLLGFLCQRLQESEVITIRVACCVTRLLSWLYFWN